MPLSADPQKRSTQLANLKQGGTVAPPGNTRAQSHGAYSAIAERELDDKVRELFDAFSADAPVRELDDSLPAADALAFKALAEVECRLDRINEYIDRRGWEDDSGKPRPVLEYTARLQAHRLELLKELAMTPAARVRLGEALIRANEAREDAMAAREARGRLDRRLGALDVSAEEAVGDD